jgi:tetratricopeptide (TPR) repeat protein
VPGYSRTDLLRILRILPRQLAAWERAGLVRSGSEYSFADLVQIKKVRDLCARQMRPGAIRRSLEALQRQAAGMENPLLEAGTLATGSGVAFRLEGRLLEPVSGQFVMDFAPGERVVTRTAPPAKEERNPEPEGDVGELFARGIALEDVPGHELEAMASYRRVLEAEPQHAAAHINLGTLCYNQHDFAAAERHYRAAATIDPHYALAYFDLGNVLDETGRVHEAIAAYKNALQLAPTYADAHYNLALAYEKLREMRNALRHWRAYVKLDQTGPWAVHARSQIRRIVASDRLRIVYRKR